MRNRKQETMQLLEELAVSAGLTFGSSHYNSSATGFKAERMSEGRDGSKPVHIWKPDDTLTYHLHPQPDGDLSMLTLKSWGNKTVIIIGQNQQPKYEVRIMISRSSGGYKPSFISHKEYELMLARLEGAGKYHPPQGDLADIRG